MEQQTEKSSVLYGLLYIGGLLSLKFLLSAPKIGFLSVISFFISVLILFLLYKFAIQYRENLHNGVISYWKAFSFLFKIYFFGSIISALIITIYTAFIKPEFLAGLLNDILTMYESMNINVDDTTYSLIEGFYKPVPMLFINLFSGAVSAAFWALIVAAFVKKEKSIFE